MKKTHIMFCALFTVLFSGFACAGIQENTSALIRKNAENKSQMTSMRAKNEPYLLSINSNEQVIIPAGKSLKISENNGQDIIYKIVNYTTIQESQKIFKSGSDFVLE